jgi:hypothetical protein
MSGQAQLIQERPGEVALGGEGGTTPLDNMRATQQEERAGQRYDCSYAETGLAVVGTSGPVCTHPFPL